MAKKTKGMLAQAVEFQMLPRLKLMGVMLVVLGAITFSYGFFSSIVEKEIILSEENAGVSLLASGLSEESSPFELTEKEQLQFYIISFIFTFLGIGCVGIANYKKKKLGC